MMRIAFGVVALLGTIALSAPAIAEDDAVQMLETDPVLIDGGSPLVCGPDIYNNTGATYFYGTSTPRWHVLDDGAFPTGTAPVAADCIDIGFYQSVSEQLYVGVNFWDTLVPGGPVCNLSFLGGVTINFGVVGVGAWTASVTLPSSITFPDDSWCVEMIYLKALPSTPSTGATVLFANGGPTVGSNNSAAYYRDANGNGTFECPSEARGFAAPNKAQFYLRVTRVAPSSTEETTWGAVKGLYR